MSTETPDTIPALADARARAWARSEFLDFDARREPKTDLFCVKCQRDLNPRRVYRLVWMPKEWQPFTYHPDDVVDGHVEDADEGRIAVVAHPIGPDCAEAHGMEWTTDAPPRPHTWQPHDLSGRHVEVCVCGIVRNATSDARPCPGVVRVTARGTASVVLDALAAQPPEAAAAVAALRGEVK